MITPYIEMKDIVKVFPPENIALDNVSLSIFSGEIHSIIGENGAGKSTLMKVLYGLEKANSGDILINGNISNISSPREAVAHGISMVHQEFMLISEYTVLENIILGDEPLKNNFFINTEVARIKIEEIMTNFKFDIPLNEKVANISIAAQQKVEIIKLLYRNVNTLILDEPTAVLAPQEVEVLFKILKKIKSENKNILFISHKLDEVLSISDRISVMRSGKLVLSKENIGLDKTSLARYMVGRDVILSIDKKDIEAGKKILDIKNMSVENQLIKGKMNVKNISLSVSEKEIVGIAGVEGNGQYELIQAIIGIMPSSGQIFISDEDISKYNIRDKRKLISYVAQDRKISGSCQEEAIVTNAVMTHHYIDAGLVNKFIFFSAKKCINFANKIIKNYQVHCHSAKVPIGSLSGGNQQKVIIGREFELDCSLLVIDQPVRGLDVGSIEYVHKTIIDKRDKGKAILLVSADLDELFSLSSRILIMHNGEIVAEKIPSKTSKEEVGEYMLGVRN